MITLIVLADLIVAAAVIFLLTYGYNKFVKNKK